MKKLCTLFLAALFLSGFLVTGNALAYSLAFDNDGTSSYQDIDRWTFKQVFESNSDVDSDDGAIFTYQSQSTGDFYEDFTMTIEEGRDATNSANYFSYESNIIDADISLTGNYDGPGLDDPDPTITFNDGSVDLLDDGTSIGSAGFTRALDATVEEGVIGDENLRLSMNLVFTFNDDLDEDYFGPDAVELAGEEWLLSFVGGQINQEDLFLPGDEDHLLDDDDTAIIQWSVSGQAMDAEFASVPEPTTLLLFGTGLLGLAAFGRKKFMNKS